MFFLHHYVNVLEGIVGNLGLSKFGSPKKYLTNTQKTIMEHESGQIIVTSHDLGPQKVAK